MLLEQLRLVLEEKCNLQPDHQVLVGLSGGPDSLCLLDALHRLGYSVVASHLDHRLRPESGEDARAVQRIALRYQLPLVSGQDDVAVFADSQALSIEEAGRLLRYRFLFQAAKERGAVAVAVGHNADDQVETVLMHLLRGAGLSGLKGMRYRELPNPWSDDIPLIRPLLSIWRDEILAYIKEQDLQAVFDASNLDIRYFRNRLRHELIPVLQGYNPQVKQLLWRMADLLSADNAALDELVDTAWDSCALETGTGYVLLDPACLQVQSLAVQRRILRRAIADLRPGLRDIDYADIERALAFLGHPPVSGLADLTAGLHLRWESNRLYLATWEADLPDAGWPQLPAGSEYYLDIPGKLSMPGGWTLSAEITEDIPAIHKTVLTNVDPFQARLDIAALEWPLLVRSRRPGDIIRPLGMQAGSIKLADLMINQKLPRRARVHWPLVLSGNQIAWVPGLRLAHPFRITNTTSKLVHLRLVKNPHFPN